MLRSAVGLATTRPSEETGLGHFGGPCARLAMMRCCFGGAAPMPRSSLDCFVSSEYACISVLLDSGERGCCPSTPPSALLSERGEAGKQVCNCGSCLESNGRLSFEPILSAASSEKKVSGRPAAGWKLKPVELDGRLLAALAHDI